MKYKKASVRLQSKFNKGSRDFITELILMKGKAAKFGLWKTMHKLDAATKAVGYEVADIRQGKQNLMVEK